MVGRVTPRSTIESESRAALNKALASASSLLSEHPSNLDALERALLASETLERAELQALL